jgi:hypothetical protein
MTKKARAITPVKVLMLNGEEREFLLSFGASKLACDDIELPLHRVHEAGVEYMAHALYHAMLDKGGLSFNDFISQFPGDMEHVAHVYTDVKEASTPARPTKTTPRKSAESGTGSITGASPDNISN